MFDGEHQATCSNAIVFFALAGQTEQSLSSEVNIFASGFPVTTTEHRKTSNDLPRLSALRLIFRNMRIVSCYMLRIDKPNSSIAASPRSVQFLFP